MSKATEKKENINMVRRSVVIPAALTLLLMTGCASTTAAASTSPEPEVRTESQEHPQPATPRTFTAAGDSITAWIDRNGTPQPHTWVSYAGNTQLVRDGSGWAKGGAKLAEIAANTTPTTADVLVIMAGTNDLGDRWGTPIGERLASVDLIVVKSGAPRVILSAVAPFNLNPGWAADWNVELKAFAAVRGWGYVDPWTAVRAPDGSYRPGLTVDGIHPTAEASALVGVAMRAALK